MLRFVDDLYHDCTDWVNVSPVLGPYVFSEALQIRA